MKTEHKCIHCYYSLIELVVALFIVAVLFTALFSALRRLNTMDRKFAAKREAVLVFDNTLERLLAEEGYDETKVETILNSEYRKSSLADRDDIQCRHNIKDGMLTMTILDEREKKLSEVSIPAQKKRK